MPTIYPKGNLPGQSGKHKNSGSYIQVAKNGKEDPKRRFEFKVADIIPIRDMMGTSRKVVRMKMG